jgi:hypothetical protein
MADFLLASFGECRSRVIQYRGSNAARDLNVCCCLYLKEHELRAVLAES